MGLSTLGFAALRGVPKGFVMTGHAGGVNTEVYQPIRAADNLIGRIGANPPGPRFSDSAWVPYDNVRGWIYCGISTTGYDYVVGSRPSSKTRVNDPVHMQGRTSCGTSGRITLIGVNVQRHDMLLFNQVRANYISAGGDSGGPTYQIVRIVKPDYPKDVVVLGVHWGWWDFNGNGVRDPDETVYSPIEGVERDLGISVMK
ncbi:MAG: hypothetical protein DDT23_01338 [candidate division WS2 bacterium]|nr:hypothetical protein [Candidatus Lithacetigena glycinireducens]